MSKFPFNSEVAFESYAHFIVLHLLYIFYVDINIANSPLFPQTNEFGRNTLHTNITYPKASTDVKISTFLVENVGMRLWITKWTFKKSMVVVP